MIIYGSRATNIGNFEIPFSKCTHCEQQSTQHISVFGKYAHIFWIPMFPIGKVAIAECTHCKRTIEQRDFPSLLRQQYQENRSLAKTPFWHWLGLAVIGGMFAMSTLVAITTGEDPRNKMLTDDLNAMTTSPARETDSISFKIKQLMDMTIIDEVSPEEFSYLTKINGNKALILVKMPKLKKVAKSEREKVLEMIEMVTKNQSELQGKEIYIGVHGAFSMMLVKTPTFQENSKLASVDELYPFYGDKETAKK